jgi:hypothetical protein
MNLSVILATNTQMCRGCCPGVTSFKTGRVSLHAIYRTHHQFDSLLGSPVVISVMAMFMYASVLMIKKNGLVFIQPLAFRLPLLLLADRV